MIRRTKDIKRRPPRTRDYREEYKRRIANALAAGKTRSAGRGHPTAADLSVTPAPFDRESPLEKALNRIKRGSTQRAAAKAECVGVERLRAYQKRNTKSVRTGRRWIISDARPVPMQVATDGAIKVVTVPVDEVGNIGNYWSQVNRFLETNKVSYLEPLTGQGVQTIEGRFVPFEVRPNTLRKLDSAGEMEFLEIYADVAK